MDQWQIQELCQIPSSVTRSIPRPAPAPGITSASQRNQRNEERRRGTCFWAQQRVEEVGTPKVQAAGRPEAGDAGEPASSGKAPRAGEKPGEKGRARGPAEA